jgi:type II secretory pathway component PulM
MDFSGLYDVAVDHLWPRLTALREVVLKTLWPRMSSAVLVGLALVAIVAISWFLMWRTALRNIPQLQEALGLRKPTKPSRAELKDEIDALKVGLEASILLYRHKLPNNVIETDYKRSNPECL